MTSLVIAEHDNHNCRASTLSTITAATQLGAEVTVLVAGDQCHSVVAQIQKVQGVTAVLHADHASYQHPLAETLAPLIVDQASGFTHILAPATTFGKNILPRAAAQLDVGQISDMMAVIDHQTYLRPIYAGNAIATVRSLDPQQFITVRTTAFEDAVMGDTVAPVTTIDFVTDNQLSSFVKQELHGADRPELASAAVVIAGGRGLGDQATFDRLSRIADTMGAAMGASRAAVDAGLAPNDWQVGQTGQVVAPTLYIAVGISGAIQHVAGMKDSQTIVAINKDPEAPIFQMADFGLVADLNDVLPEWEAVLTK